MRTPLLWLTREEESIYYYLHAVNYITEVAYCGEPA